MPRDTPLSPADLADSVIQSPVVIHTAEVVLGQWGKQFAEGFQGLRFEAKVRERTDAYNVLIEAEKLVLHWVRISDSRVPWLRAEEQQPATRWKTVKRCAHGWSEQFRMYCGQCAQTYQPNSGTLPAKVEGRED